MLTNKYICHISFAKFICKVYLTNQSCPCGQKIGHRYVTKTVAIEMTTEIYQKSNQFDFEQSRSIMGKMLHGQSFERVNFICPVNFDDNKRLATMMLI